MIRGEVNKGKIKVKIEGSIIDLLAELQLLNLNVMDAISNELNIPLEQVLELSFSALQEIIQEGAKENGKPNN